MRGLTLALVLASAISLTPTKMAGQTTLGPLTFGSGAPLWPQDSGFYPPDEVQLWLEGPTTFTAGSTPESELVTYTFGFNIAPGWAISGMGLNVDGIDDTTGESGLPQPPVWGYAIQEEMTLCSAEDVCSSAVLSPGNAHEEPPNGNAYDGAVPLGGFIVGPGTGVFQEEISAVNDTVGFPFPGDNVAFIGLEQVSNPTSVPEGGSTWLYLILAGATILGAVFTARCTGSASRV